MNSQQLNTARAALWRQNGQPLLTLEDARAWLTAFGLVPFLPLKSIAAGQLLTPAPSFVEACLGAASATPPPPAIAAASEMLSRLTADGTVIPLNLMSAAVGPGQPGAAGEQPDFLCSVAALEFVYALRGERSWKVPPATTGSAKVSRLARSSWEILEKNGPATADSLRESLGRDVTEAAVLRALHELWTGLRIYPVFVEYGTPAQWDLLGRRFPREVNRGAGSGQSAALSGLLSYYLAAVIAASAEEVETFLSPLTARSKVREMVHGLEATRQLDLLPLDARTLLHLKGALPEFAPEPAPVSGPISAPVSGPVAAPIASTVLLEAPLPDGLPQDLAAAALVEADTIAIASANASLAASAILTENTSPALDPGPVPEKKIPFNQTRATYTVPEGAGFIIEAESPGSRDTSDSRPPRKVFDRAGRTAASARAARPTSARPSSPRPTGSRSASPYAAGKASGSGSPGRTYPKKEWTPRDSGGEADRKPFRPRTAPSSSEFPRKEWKPRPNAGPGSFSKPGSSSKFASSSRPSGVSRPGSFSKSGPPSKSAPSSAGKAWTPRPNAATGPGAAPQRPAERREWKNRPEPGSRPSASRSFEKPAGRPYEKKTWKPRPATAPSAPGDSAPRSYAKPYSKSPGKSFDKPYEKKPYAGRSGDTSTEKKAWKPRPLPSVGSGPSRTYAPKTGARFGAKPPSRFGARPAGRSAGTVGSYADDSAASPSESRRPGTTGPRTPGKFAARTGSAASFAGKPASPARPYKRSSAGKPFGAKPAGPSGYKSAGGRPAGFKGAAGNATGFKAKGSKPPRTKG